MEGIRGDDPISTICRREGIHANMYYKWLKSFMEAGKERLKGEEKRGVTHGEVEELKRDNTGSSSWKIKRLFAWLFNFRRLVVRYEYHAENFQGFVHLGAIMILMRHL